MDGVFGHRPVPHVQGGIVLEPGDHEPQRGVVLDAAVQPEHGAPLHHLVLGAPHDPGGVCMGSQTKGHVPNSSGPPMIPVGSA